jgi:hypothetical protein
MTEDVTKESNSCRRAIKRIEIRNIKEGRKRREGVITKKEAQVGLNSQ